MLVLGWSAPLVSLRILQAQVNPSHTSYDNYTAQADKTTDKTRAVQRAWGGTKNEWTDNITDTIAEERGSTSSRFFYSGG